MSRWNGRSGWSFAGVDSGYAPHGQRECADGNDSEIFNAVRTFVDDLDRARRFYRDVFELREKSAGPDWAVFDIDGRDIVLEAMAEDDPERALVGRLLAVSFTVDDIDDAYRNLVARGVSFPAPPEMQPWGGILAFPRDPDETF